MAKTIALVGAGPGIGMAIARRFAREGYQIGLIARNRQSLEGYVGELKGLGVKAGAFPADVLDRDALVAALGQIKRDLGPIDVLEFGPTPTAESLASPRNISVDVAQFHFNLNPLAAIAATRAVLPDMLEKRSGALLYTSAISASMPIPPTASFGVAAAALRTYALTLNLDLAGDGIYAGLLTVAGTVDKGGGAPPSPYPTVLATEIADVAWDMVTKRDRAEQAVGDVAKIEALLSQMYGAKRG